MTVGYGDFRYELDDSWPKVPRRMVARFRARCGSRFPRPRLRLLPPQTPRRRLRGRDRRFHHLLGRRRVHRAARHLHRCRRSCVGHRPPGARRHKAHPARREAARAGPSRLGHDDRYALRHHAGSPLQHAGRRGHRQRRQHLHRRRLRQPPGPPLLRRRRVGNLLGDLRHRAGPVRARAPNRHRLAGPDSDLRSGVQPASRFSTARASSSPCGKTSTAPATSTAAPTS